MSTNHTWSGPEPDTITAWSIVRAGHYAGQLFYKELALVGLTPTQFGALLRLDLEPGMSNNQLARAVHVTPQSMSELLTTMSEMGLIERTEPKGRGHRLLVRLTPSGVAALKKCQAVIASIEASLGLSTKESETLNKLLHQVLHTSHSA